MRTAARGALLEALCVGQQVSATAGSQLTDCVLDCRLRGNDAQRP